MSITAQMVKELREKTNAAMMDCKKALVECEGVMEKAIDWLRQKGLSKAASKSDRATKEGVIVLQSLPEQDVFALCALQCETDFVARNDAFVALAKELANAVAAGDTLESYQEKIQNAVATLGENITLGSSVRYEKSKENAIIGTYVHANGKFAAIVELESSVPVNDSLTALAKELAMQIVATKPVAIDSASVPQSVIDREKEVYRAKALEEGKPENIVEKIVDGAIKKYYKEACLLEQPYIKDDKITVQEYINTKAKENNATITVVRFEYMALGN